MRSLGATVGVCFVHHGLMAKYHPERNGKTADGGCYGSFFLSTNMRNDLSNEETPDSSANGMNIFSVPFLQEDVSYLPNGSKFFAHQKWMANKTYGFV